MAIRVDYPLLACALAASSHWYGFRWVLRPNFISHATRGSTDFFFSSYVLVGMAHSTTTITLASHPEMKKTLRLSHQTYKTDHLKRSTSLPGTNEPTAESLMSSRITSSFNRRILICADHLNGGWGDMLNFQTCTILLEIFLLFQVSNFHVFCHSRD